MPSAAFLLRYPPTLKLRRTRATEDTSPPGGVRLGALTSGLRSGLSLHPPPLSCFAPRASQDKSAGLRCCPSSLYTFPEGVALRAWLGIAISGFPDFEQFCIAGFPASTQVCLSPQRLPFRHARMAGDLQLSNHTRSETEFTRQFPGAMVVIDFVFLFVFVGSVMVQLLCFVGSMLFQDKNTPNMPAAHRTGFGSLSAAIFSCRSEEKSPAFSRAAFRAAAA